MSPFHRPQNTWPWITLNDHFTLSSTLFADMSGALKPGFRSLATLKPVVKVGEHQTETNGIARFPCDSTAFLSNFFHFQQKICSKRWLKIPQHLKSVAYTLPVKHNVSFRLLIFHKIVQQSFWSIVASLMISLLQIYRWVCPWKNILKFGHYLMKSWMFVSKCFGPLWTCRHCCSRLVCYLRLVVSVSRSRWSRWPISTSWTCDRRMQTAVSAGWFLSWHGDLCYPAVPQTPIVSVYRCLSGSSKFPDEHRIWAYLSISTGSVDLEAILQDKRGV